MTMTNAKLVVDCCHVIWRISDSIAFAINRKTQMESPVSKEAVALFCGLLRDEADRIQSEYERKGKS